MSTKVLVKGHISRGSKDAGGLDIYSAEDVELPVGFPTMVKTDLFLAIPKGYVGLIRDRSSIGSKGVIVTAGVIDSDYRGEILVCFLNLSSMSYVIEKGNRIAQIIIVPCLTDFESVLFLNESERGESGFGSTGT